MQINLQDMHWVSLLQSYQARSYQARSSQARSYQTRSYQARSYQPDLIDDVKPPIWHLRWYINPRKGSVQFVTIYWISRHHWLPWEAVLSQLSNQVSSYEITRSWQITKGIQVSISSWSKLCWTRRLTSEFSWIRWWILENSNINSMCWGGEAED